MGARVDQRARGIAETPARAHARLTDPQNPLPTSPLVRGRGAGRPPLGPLLSKGGEVLSCWRASPPLRPPPLLYSSGEETFSRWLTPLLSPSPSSTEEGVRGWCSPTFSLPELRRGDFLFGSFGCYSDLFGSLLTSSYCPSTGSSFLSDEASPDEPPLSAEASPCEA